MRQVIRKESLNLGHMFLRDTSRYFKAVILENNRLNKHFRLLIIKPASAFSLKNPLPGQFYMLQVGNTYDPFLKRPFSIFASEDNILKFLYRIRGKGTSCLSNLKNGDLINVIGPLGNSYPTPEGDFIAVAGGIGIASLFPLLEQFKRRVYLFYGTRNKEELIMLTEVKSLVKELFITTDDGSEGKRGLITEVLRDFLNSLLVTRYSLPIYACGPTQMLKELPQIIAGKGIKCYISLEEHMACGVGACLGCVVKVRSQRTEDRGQIWTYKRVCKEGPVFDIREIVWE